MQGFSGPQLRRPAPHVVVFNGGYSDIVTDSYGMVQVQPVGASPIIALGGWDGRLERLEDRLERLRSKGKRKRALKVARKIVRLEAGGDKGRGVKDFLAWTLAPVTGGASVAYRYKTRNNWKNRQRAGAMAPPRPGRPDAFRAYQQQGADESLQMDPSMPMDAASLPAGDLVVEDSAGSATPWGLIIGGGLVLFAVLGAGAYVMGKGKRKKSGA